MARRSRHGARAGLAARVGAALALAGLAAAPGHAQERYDVLFSARFLPSQGLARASIRVEQARPALRKKSPWPGSLPK